MAWVVRIFVAFVSVATAYVSHARRAVTYNSFLHDADKSHDSVNVRDRQNAFTSLIQKTATLSLEAGVRSTGISKNRVNSTSKNITRHVPEVALPQVNESNAVPSLSGISYLASAAVRHLDPFYKDMNDTVVDTRRISSRISNWTLEGHNIWNESSTWVNFTFWHPAGVVSNVYDGKVVWASVGFLSLTDLCGLSVIAYPVLPIAIVLMWGICVSLCLTPAQQDEDAPDTEPDRFPYISPSKLTPRSQLLYNTWRVLCCCLPALLVFGVPLGLIALSYPYPQEVFVLTLVVSSAFAFSHGVYMAFFVPFVLENYSKGDQSLREGGLRNRGSEKHVSHWVFFPNYKEDLEVLSLAVGSVAKSTLATTQIGIVLAMEEREAGAEQKALKLRATFDRCFSDIQITVHPKDLPNDPPGKASNMAYAFKSLLAHLEETRQDTSKTIITVADADSEFHPCYFEELTHKFSEAEDPTTTVWQSPVYHFKNYHRQPGPCVVGSLITAMVETAYLADPNAIRFPYSTYSIPLSLASMVGGWDPEWIAEDWHMGIKCFLLTLGRSQVETILLPTLNYSPEESTWIGTVAARWAQAKRHALGFSDLSYFFMMLPLIFVKIISSSKSPGLDLRGFWKLVFVGWAHVIRLVNTHVIIGVMTLYAILDVALKRVMMLLLGQIRGIGELFDRTLFAATMFAVATTSMTLIVTVNFQVLYKALEYRFEKPRQDFVWLYKNTLCHWIFTAICFAVWGVFYFTAMAAAAWIAAVKCMFFWHTGGFEYVVASKPTSKIRT